MEFLLFLVPFELMALQSIRFPHQSFDAIPVDSTFKITCADRYPSPNPTIAFINQVNQPNRVLLQCLACCK